MGNACGIKSKAPSQPTKVSHKPSKPLNNNEGTETEIEGIPMRTACIGHYFSELSYTSNDETAIREAWRKVCSPEANGSQDAVPLFVRRRQMLVDVGLTEAEAEERLTEFAENNPEVFGRMLREGPPARYRWTAWKVALKIRNIRIPGLYEELAKRTTPWAGDIEKDINRTFPRHPLFSEVKFCERGRRALRNILSAYASYNKYVGYCQGMNFISAFLLIVSGFQEEEAFWGVVSMTRYRFAGDPLGIDGIEGLYSDQFPLLRSLEWLFERIAAETLPTLTRHLAALEFSNGFWLQKWISTVFLYSFPRDYCIRFWDFILTRGIAQIFPLIIAVMGHLSSQLLISDFTGCYELISTLQENPDSLPPVDKLIAAASRIDLNWQSLSEMYKRHQEEMEKKDFEARRRNAGQKGREDVNPQDTDREVMEEIVEEGKESFPEIRQLGKKQRALASVSRSNEKITLPPINQEKKNKFVFESSSLFISEGEPTKREHKLNNSMELAGSRKEFQVRQSLQLPPNAIHDVVEEEEKARFKKFKHASTIQKEANSVQSVSEDRFIFLDPAQNHTERPKIRQGTIDRSVRELRSRVIAKQFCI